MKKLKLLSFTLACVASVVVLASFKSGTAAPATSPGIFLDHKTVPRPCLLPNGTVHSYVDGCTPAVDYVCRTEFCPPKTRPDGPPGTISRKAN